MSKAILVVDMPSDCNHCQFADFSNGQWECNQHKGGRIADAMKVRSVPSWCPLRPMPNKKTIFYEYEIEDLMNLGWNACIDEILGETDECVFYDAFKTITDLITRETE